MLTHSRRKILTHRSNATGLATLLELYKRGSENLTEIPQSMSYWHSETINRGAKIILHKIRLGYHCSWQNIETNDYVDKYCKYPGETNATLLHYQQSCEHTISEARTTHSSRWVAKIMPFAYIVAAAAPVGNLATMTSIQ